MHPVCKLVLSILHRQAQDLTYRGTWCSSGTSSWRTSVTGILLVVEVDNRAGRSHRDVPPESFYRHGRK
jgi:hypothetical protein